MLWYGKWIWKSKKITINSFAYFRKVIKIGNYDEIHSALIFVSAHHHFKLYINGIKTGGYVSPAPSHPSKGKLYLTYDIKESLHAGENAICTIVHYLGGDGQNYINGHPGFILQCEITLKNGHKEIIGTDETWKVVDKTPYQDGAPYQQNRRMSAIQSYNANIYPEGWLLSGFDDSFWKNAVYSVINDENWNMVPQSIPEGYIEEVIEPKPVSIQEKGLQVFDAGKIVSGWPILEIKGIHNVSIRMRYSENLDEAGRVGHNVTNETSENYYDEYFMHGGNIEKWSPDFSYKAFRFIEVTGYPELILPENIRIASAHTQISYKGSFNSSNQLFNDIFEACIQTQKNNVLGQLVDCPHREQAQYLADSDLQAETLGYFFSSRHILAKVLEDFCNAQLEDGTFPFVFPGNFDHPEFKIMIPEWDLHFCLLMWKVYFLFGDVSVLKKYYPAAKKMLGYYLGTKDKSLGLVPKSKDRWHISDWPYPNINHDGDYLTIQNIKIYQCLVVMEKAAHILNELSDISFFKEQSGKLKASIRQYLYNPVDKCFYDTYGSTESHQGTNVLGYQYGLVPESDRETLLDHIVKDGMQSKVLLSLNLFRVLFENGRGQEAYRLLNSTEYPGWGLMIASGSKTIWEGFDDIESHCHAWNAYPARLFAEYLLGIKPTSPAFSTIDINPFIPDGMQFAEGCITTVKGDIYVRWDKIGEKCIIKVKVPADVETNLIKIDGSEYQLEKM